MSLDVAGVLGPDGHIARRLPDYEVRSQQLEMAHAVEQAIADRQHLVVEAGTGTGKSFAYLVPAILAATARQGEAGEKRKRIVVSTHTISLQEQLIARDLPFLNAVLPVEFSAVLVKGRSNYMSLRRMQGAVERSRNLFSRPDDLDHLQQIFNWSAATTDGSLADLPFRPAPPVWDEVQSEHGNCLGKNCPRYEQCFYYKARRRAWNADLLVVNHALFFSDLALRRQGASVLPEYDVVLFDEAHTLEQVAGDHLGMTVSLGQLEYMLGRLYNDRTQKGLLSAPEHRPHQRRVDEARLLGRDLFFLLRDQQTRLSRNGRFRAPPAVNNVLSPLLSELSRQLERIAGTFDREELKIEYTAAADRCTGLADDLQAWLTQSHEESVYWLEASGPDQRRIKLLCAPIDVGPVLRDELFNKVDTAILTSATLAIGEEDFQFVRRRTGLMRAQELKLGSPFNYREQVKLILAEGMPDPGDSPAEYEVAVCERLKCYLDLTQGRAFVLFTSYRMLQNCARRLSDWLIGRGYGLYVQGEDLSRSQLLDRFREDPAGVLFGADSFWQGVDVPGDALQHVIITKLPFSVPDHPLLEARVEAIRQRGGNPFVEYQVPEAIIRLKQGFGRLIRRRTDRGYVTILDPRVQTKPYGKTFLASLPKCERVDDPFRDRP